LIDFELIDVTDISKWFMIWWHSSWYWYDNSYLKNVFSWLDNLKSWDIVELIRDDWIKITYKIKNKEIKKLSDKITLSNKFYIYTCYPIWTNKKRLVIELEEIKK
jgi:sortase (surface protein transpeptidase)